MRRTTSSACLIAILGLVTIILPSAPTVAKSVTENRHQVVQWNRFANRLLQVHRHYLQTKDVVQTAVIGGYAGMPNFYREVSSFERNSRRLLSRIRWEVKRPDRVHVIELLVYNGTGQLIRDYSAAYLPGYRNAPFQTLINLHRRPGDLEAFRQFDASGARLFEFCNGNWFDQVVKISLDEPLVATPDHIFRSEPYVACFGSIPAEVGRFIDAGVDMQGLSGANFEGSRLPENTETELALLNLRLRFSPNSAELYLARGNVYLKAQLFPRAISDFNQAIKLNDRLDMAYFGRGMARGRAGKLSAGISDLTVYIDRNPTSSLAYTKRGVRYIWKGDLQSAEKDLRRAIQLNPRNAEAHDDLGVVMARRGDYKSAVLHFRTTVKLEPSYQKGFHNLALTLHVLGQPAEALDAIDKALSLGRDTRSSVLLKATILDELGRAEDAKRLRQDAETLPKKNWSENLAVE